MDSPTLQTLQDPILLLPWVCFRGGGPPSPGEEGGSQFVPCPTKLRMHRGAWRDRAHVEAMAAAAAAVGIQAARTPRCRGPDP
jgi:hypothetical protein